MNTTQDDGGPAFPSKRMENIALPDQKPNFAELEYAGLSIRDWFAGMALSGLIERDTKIAVHELSKADREPAAPILYKDGSAYTDLAKEAYIIAAEMLTARKEAG